MTDQRFTELLSKKLSGELSPEEHQEFLLMLEENAGYRHEFASLLEYFQREEQPEEVSIPPFQKIKERIGYQEVKRSRSFTVVYRAVAAIFFLGILTFAAYRIFPLKTQQPDGSAVSWKKWDTRAGHKAEVLLADGTRITLNKESEIRYPATFKGALREVYLTGEAFFEVAKDHQHPFIVHTAKMSIKVLGTAFNVKAYNNEGAAEATLLRGKIEVTLEGQPGKAIILKPADKFTLVLNNTGKQLENVQYSISPMTYFDANDKNSIIETSWMNDKLSFKNETFGMLGPRFSRWYGVKMIFGSSVLKEYKFTGELKKETLDEALKALKLITPFDYRIDGKTVYLYPSR